MDTLSFILGIALVVVAALAVVATFAFVKVIRITNQLDHTQRDVDLKFSEVFQTISEDTRHIHQRIDGFERDVYSQLDSRLDKLENKLTNTK